MNAAECLTWIGDDLALIMLRFGDSPF